LPNKQFKIDEAVTNIACLATGQTVLVGSADGYLRIVDISASKLLFEK